MRQSCASPKILNETMHPMYERALRRSRGVLGARRRLAPNKQSGSALSVLSVRSMYRARETGTTFSKGFYCSPSRSAFGCSSTSNSVLVTLRRVPLSCRESTTPSVRQVEESGTQTSSCFRYVEKNGRRFLGAANVGKTLTSCNIKVRDGVPQKTQDSVLNVLEAFAMGTAASRAE